MSRNRLGSSSVDKPPKKPFANPLRLLTYPDVLLLLFYNGVVYAAFYGVTASLSVVFKTSYPFLSETDIGLCYLAIGGGVSAAILRAGGNGIALDASKKVPAALGDLVEGF